MEVWKCMYFGGIFTALADSCVENLSQNFVLAGYGDRVLLEKLDLATKGTDQGNGLRLRDLF